MRIVQLLHHAYHLNDRDFIKELYRQLLNREADDQEVDHYSGVLSTGYSKRDLIIHFFNSDEAMTLFNKRWSGQSDTVAGKLQYMLILNPDTFVTFLYLEMLCRYGEPEGYENHLKSLNEGGSPFDVIQSFLASDEWLHLLESDTSIITERMRSCFLTSRY